MVIFEKSECHGKGLIAGQDIPRGKILHVTQTWSSKHNIWINVKPNCMYNHSKLNENSELKTIDRAKILVTLKDIKAGEEIFVDFTKDKDLEQPEGDWKQ
jgi:SET domain-containing protein|tara:strand:- start:2642 stop:2941 length:300 start_codon:yes stop_codon:yes gene_type:complete